MGLDRKVAENFLKDRLDNPVKDIEKILAFKVSGTRLLALWVDKNAKNTHIWFEPPLPPNIPGLRVKKRAVKNADLTGDLKILYPPNGCSAEIQTEAALREFVEWYEATALSKAKTLVA